MEKTVCVMGVEIDYLNINAISALTLLKHKINEVTIELMLTDITYDDLRKYAMLCNAFRDSVAILSYISVIDEKLQSKFELLIIKEFEKVIPEEYHVDFELALSEGVEF